MSVKEWTDYAKDEEWRKEIAMERSANSSDRDWKIEWEEEQTLTLEEEREADWDSREKYDDSWVESDRRIVEGQPLP